MMLTAEKNYSNCPLKKRPFLIMDKDEKNSVEQCEPEDLSVNSKRRRSDSSSPLYADKRCSSVDTMIEIEDDDAAKPLSLKIAGIKVEKSPSSDSKRGSPSKSADLLYKSWTCPLTPPMHFPGPNESLDSIYAAARYEAHLRDEYTFKPQTALPPYASSYLMPAMDIRTNYNNNIIKADTFINPKFFTPYRVDLNSAASSNSSSHRPLFNVFPLSPASSQASYNSYEQSPRRSESPMSTNSSMSEQPSTVTVTSAPPSTYSLFRDVTAMSTGAPSEKTPTKSKADKVGKNSHYQCPDCSKSYSTYSGLSKHQQFHCPAVEGNQAKKIFSCKNCDKVYTSLGKHRLKIVFMIEDDTFMPLASVTPARFVWFVVAALH